VSVWTTENGTRYGFSRSCSIHTRVVLQTQTNSGTDKTKTMDSPAIFSSQDDDPTMFASQDEPEPLFNSQEAQDSMERVDRPRDCDHDAEAIFAGTDGTDGAVQKNGEAQDGRSGNATENRGHVEPQTSTCATAPLGRSESGPWGVIARQSSRTMKLTRSESGPWGILAREARRLHNAGAAAETIPLSRCSTVDDGRFDFDVSQGVEPEPFDAMKQAPLVRSDSTERAVSEATTAEIVDDAAPEDTTETPAGSGAASSRRAPEKGSAAQPKSTVTIQRRTSKRLANRAKRRPLQKTTHHTASTNLAEPAPQKRKRAGVKTRRSVFVKHAKGSAFRLGVHLVAYGGLSISDVALRLNIQPQEPRSLKRYSAAHGGVCVTDYAEKFRALELDPDVVPAVGRHFFPEGCPLLPTQTLEPHDPANPVCPAPTKQVGERWKGSNGEYECVAHKPCGCPGGTGVYAVVQKLCNRRKQRKRRRKAKSGK